MPRLVFGPVQLCLLVQADVVAKNCGVVAERITNVGEKVANVSKWFQVIRNASVLIHVDIWIWWRVRSVANVFDCKERAQ